MLKLTARHADVWNAGGVAGREIDTAVAAPRQLDDACLAIDRDPNEIRRSVQVGVGAGSAETIDRVRQFRAHAPS